MKRNSKIKNEQDQVYFYIKDDILGWNNYSSKYLIMRLLGFKEGKFYRNKNESAKANYTWKQIYITSCLYHAEIMNWLNANSAKANDEKAMVNGVLYIISIHINDVIMRIERALQAEKMAEKIDVSPETQSEYKKISEDRVLSQELNDIW